MNRDSFLAANVAAAKAGLAGAGDAIKKIALALVTGQTAPAEERDLVASSLNTAKVALDAISAANT